MKNCHSFEALGNVAELKILARSFKNSPLSDELLGREKEADVEKKLIEEDRKLIDSIIYEFDRIVNKLGFKLLAGSIEPTSIKKLDLEFQLEMGRIYRFLKTPMRRAGLTGKEKITPLERIDIERSQKKFSAIPLPGFIPLPYNFAKNDTQKLQAHPAVQAMNKKLLRDELKLEAVFFSGYHVSTDQGSGGGEEPYPHVRFRLVSTKQSEALTDEQRAFWETETDTTYYHRWWYYIG